MRGIVFTVEAMYVMVIVFSALMVFLASVQTIDPPNFDQVQEMKVAHDMGEEINASVKPPADYETTCTEHGAKLAYYGTEVCLK